MLRKPRPDSVIGSQLPPIIKDDVDTMLLSGESYRKVQQRLEEDGIKLSQEPSGATTTPKSCRRVWPGRTRRPRSSTRYPWRGWTRPPCGPSAPPPWTWPPPRPATLRPLTSWWDSSSRPSSWPKTSAASRYWRPRLPRPTPPNRSPQSTLTPEERDRKLRNIFGC